MRRLEDYEGQAQYEERAALREKIAAVCAERDEWRGWAERAEAALRERDEALAAAEAADREWHTLRARMTQKDVAYDREVRRLRDVLTELLAVTDSADGGEVMDQHDPVKPSRYRAAKRAAREALRPGERP